jgi:hypothetical protein
MCTEVKNVNFSLNLVFHAQLLDLGLVEDLYRDRVPCDGMSGEFGMEEYDQMMKAAPNAKGSTYDQRLYKVMSRCSSILPR